MFVLNFFYQLSQICYNKQSLNISLNDSILNGLANLIYVQRNLKYLSIFNPSRTYSINVTSLLTKLPNTLIKLNIRYPIPLLFITKFANLQELVLDFYDMYDDVLEDFEKLQHITFSQLHVLRF